MDVSYAELVGLIVCFILSGFFSGSEAVLMSIGVDRAKQIIEEGGTQGKALKFMVEKPSELLATILVGNNIVNIFAASLTTVIATRMFKDDAVGISVGVTTVLILIFGEVIPKSFSRSHAEALSTVVIRILQLFYFLLYPIVKAMVLIIRAVLGENAEITGRLTTKNDIEFMVQKAEKERSMDSKQLDLLSSILEFPTIKVKDIMIPRSKVKYVALDSTFGDIIRETKDDIHSRYPVCENGALEEVKGFLHVKDLVYLTDAEKESFEIQSYLKAPFFVYEHMKIQAVFDHMNRKKVHLALVKDENGLVVGIITLEDIVEEILGDIEDEHDVEEGESEAQQDLHSYDGVVVEGAMSIRDLYNDFDIKIPLNDNYSTVAGFILDMLGNNFPEEGQIIVWEGYSFELEKVDEYEVREIRIKDTGGNKHIFSKKEAMQADEENSDDETPTKSDNLELNGAK